MFLCLFEVYEHKNMGVFSLMNTQKCDKIKNYYLNFNSEVILFSVSRDFRSSSSSSDIRPPSTSSTLSDLRPPSADLGSPSAQHMRPLALDVRPPTGPVDLRAQANMHSPTSRQILEGTTQVGADGKELFFCHLCSYVGE